MLASRDSPDSHCYSIRRRDSLDSVLLFSINIHRSPRNVGFPLFSDEGISTSINTVDRTVTNNEIELFCNQTTQTVTDM